MPDSGEVPTLVAEPGAGQGMTQAARDALRKVDSVLTENSGALKDTIANFKVFSEGLARNTGKLDGIVAGLERMTGVTAPPAKDHLRFARPAKSGTGGQDHQRAMGDPGADSGRDAGDAAVPVLAGAGLSGVCGSVVGRQLPKLLQARLIESFENYDIAHAPLRMAILGRPNSSC